MTQGPSRNPKNPYFDTLRNQIKTLREENSVLRAKLKFVKETASLAYVDELTGLANRRRMNQRLTEEVQRALRYSDQVFSIIMLDLDNFKEINDHFGHDIGDKALKWYALFLQRCTRQTDICCRVSGDEFVIVLPNTDQKGCQLLIARLQKTFANAKIKTQVVQGFSIGAATFGIHGKTVNDLLKHADSMMYRIKRETKELAAINTPLPARGTEPNFIATMS